MAENYINEKWVDVYQAALLELQLSLVSGRIRDARAEIVARLEMLEALPGLHAEERSALSDAVNGLRSLEIQDERYTYAMHRQATHAAINKLRALEPALLRLLSP